MKINTPGDRSGREADRIADEVMRTSESGLQRTCACGGESGDESEEGNRVQRCIQRKETGSVERNEAPDIAERVIHDSPGQRVDSGVRTFMESRFGYDFDNVRIHSDAQANKAAHSVNALAYTTGNHVVFREGMYRPETESGKRLLAHELTHVIQQSGAATPSVQRMGDASKVPAGLPCPVAIDSPPNVDTNILFTLESATLSPAAVADIDAFRARWTAAGANRAVRIDGYASTDGPDPLNWTLSCNRAKAVETALTAPAVGTGIPAALIQISAQGETDEFSTALPPNRRATISADLTPAPPPCANPGVSRVLDLQPVFLRTDAADASPTGASWTRRLNESNAIWGKLGVTFNDLGAVTIDTPLKTTGSTGAEIGAVAALRTGSGVEVFIVDNDMAGSGGASTLGPLAALCNTGKIVMSDRGTSDTLLAHELGHILGIQHPGTPPNPGDPGTIMVGTGSHSTANSTRNTMANFAAILCPAPTGTTCLNPDP